jgi:hypothetical protein
MLRKRRQPAPNFRMPGAPFNPATGERAPLGAYPPRGTTLALFQVVGDDPQDPETADTHDNYVVCRGYEADVDPNFRYLHDPYTKPDTTPINVAKPYAVRGTFPYTQGQVIVAARIKGRLGYNAGKATLPTVGQPEDLSDELELLLDDSDVGIAWLDISQPSTAPSIGILQKQSIQNITSGAPAIAPWDQERGDFSRMGFTADLLNGTLTYSGESRWFLHHAISTVSPASSNSTGTHVTGSVVVGRDLGGGSASTPGNDEGSFYWPGGRATVGGLPPPVLNIHLGQQQVPFLYPQLAEDGWIFKLYAVHDGFDFDIENAYWSVTPLE